MGLLLGFLHSFNAELPVQSLWQQRVVKSDQHFCKRSLGFLPDVHLFVAPERRGVWASEKWSVGVLRWRAHSHSFS